MIARNHAYSCNNGLKIFFIHQEVKFTEGQGIFIG